MKPARYRTTRSIGGQCRPWYLPAGTLSIGQRTENGATIVRFQDKEFDLIEVENNPDFERVPEAETVSL
jgi:hypothetical protein